VRRPAGAGRAGARAPANLAPAAEARFVRPHAMVLRILLLATLLCTAAGACRERHPINYSAADPVLDARRAALDSGRIRLLAIAIGDSQIVPWDTTVTREKSYNITAPMVLLQPDPRSEQPGQPSEAQLRYVTLYNTAILALVDTNAMGARPN